VPSPSQLRPELGKVLESKVFASAQRMRRLLEFIVDHNLRFPGEPLKEITIGASLYANGGDFDPRLTAAVRVDATRLRGKLREYYASEGANDSVIIELPKGSYTPVIRAANPPRDVQRVASEPSIAVLPFSNLSPEPSDYFSDGLTEEIIHALAGVRGMRVVARTSCFALKHRNADVREVGRTLNVDFILEGSVRMSGQSLRVTVQLVSAADGFQLWSRRYERKIDDVFAVQDDIAREIVNTLRSGAPTQTPFFRSGKPENLEAYSWYLRGRYHLNRQTGESLHRAVECFEQALKLSPEYAPALSGEAVAWLYLGYFAMSPPVEALPRARHAATRALAVNELEAEALAVVACTKGMLEWDWSGAESLFSKALAAEPGSDFPKHLFTMFVVIPLGRFEESLALIDEATRSDPLSLFVSASKTATLLSMQRNAEAEAECRRVLELDPDFWRAIVGLGRCYEAQGRYGDSIACYERAKVVSDRVPSAIGGLGRIYALAGRREEAYRQLNELEVLARSRYVSPWGQALILLGLGDDRVFDALERSCNERAAWAMYLATDPRFDPVRSVPRFLSILRKLRVPVLSGLAAARG
jgi:serine/threonine-protein kinase